MVDAPANQNLDTAKIVTEHAAKFALGLIDAPVTTPAARPARRPKLTVIQGGRIG